MTSAALAILRSRQDWLSTRDIIEAICPGDDRGLQQAIHIALLKAWRAGQLDRQGIPRRMVFWRWLESGGQPLGRAPDRG